MNGPEDGYGSGRKSHYRRRIHNLLESFEPMRSTPRADRLIVLLDEWEAREAQYLIEQRGYRPDQLHIVNLNPATAARITLSLKQAGHVGATTYGKGLADAVARILARGKRIHAIHADFCGNVSSPQIHTTLELIRFASEKAPVAVAVNVLRGREQAWFQSNIAQCKALFKVTPSADAARVRALSHALQNSADDDTMLCAAHLHRPVVESYNSTNGQSFLFLVGEFRKHGQACEDAQHIRWLYEIGTRVRAGARLTLSDMVWPQCVALPVKWVNDEHGHAWAALDKSLALKMRERMLSRVSESSAKSSQRAEERSDREYADADHTIKKHWWRPYVGAMRDDDVVMAMRSGDGKRVVVIRDTRDDREELRSMEPSE